MHANDGSLAENWVIERGGRQLDRANIAFGHHTGRSTGSPGLERVEPKRRCPPSVSARASDPPIRDRARALYVLLFANPLGFADAALNLDETVLECLAATPIMYYPDLLLLAESCTLVGRMREVIAARTIGEAEVLAWSATIPRVFIPLQVLLVLVNPAATPPVC
ncbi:hypothetical protein PR003_g2747 [Phytophthora rubi]|uniref:Uncharacterized protein n=1 Tax=Phytophthora rubi TaxID=129364 RepID=A0A6A4G165_9STRA|nr:hypothetical protein PR003_g2747 [Phytophthora rubi]